MKNLLTILLVIILFVAFLIFDVKRKSYLSVLKVVNANEIQIDLNSNGRFDMGENICLGEDVFTSNLMANQDDLIKKAGITFPDAIKIGYLTDNFADDILTDKKVKIKLLGEQNQDCKFADIFINKESYRDKLINTGFTLNSTNFPQKLEKAKELDLVILNHKSNKYHELTCEYGQIAHDAVIVPKRFLLKDAIPCKFCHVQKSTKTQKPVEKTYPITISNGNIKMYLTDFTLKLKPDENCTELVCKDVLNRINNTQKSIDIALYGFDNVPALYNALVSAKNRGVKIRLVYDNSKKSYYPETDMIINLADEKSGDDIKSLMHNKFMIFDEKSVITGSMNFSKTGLSGFNSNAIFSIDSPEIAKIYEEEFSQMLKGKFHQTKSKHNHKIIQLGTSKINIFFSPKDKIITNNIIQLIENAQKYIYIPAFIITHDGLSNALIKAKQRGVDVKIIIDATNVHSTKSKVKTLRNASVPLKVENFAGKLHSKSIIIDDKYVIAGSMNFTNSGENKNDENSLIIEDARFARYYKGFFEYIWEKIPDKYLTKNPSAEGKASIGSCFDGIDNDFDGKIDTEDEGCR